MPIDEFYLMSFTYLSLSQKMIYLVNHIIFSASVAASASGTTIITSTTTR
jgi:hypothetical protein